MRSCSGALCSSNHSIVLDNQDEVILRDGNVYCNVECVWVSHCTLHLFLPPPCFLLLPLEEEEEEEEEEAEETRVSTKLRITIRIPS